MIDLNDIFNRAVADALTRVVETHLKPLQDRIAETETQILEIQSKMNEVLGLDGMTDRLEEIESTIGDLDEEIGKKIDNAISEYDFSEAVKEALDETDLEEMVEDKVKDALSKATVTFDL